MGACRVGTLQCRAGSAAPVCVGAAPTAEQCDAVDQDCDGNPVNGFDLEQPTALRLVRVSCLYFQTCCGGKCVSAEFVLQRSGQLRRRAASLRQLSGLLPGRLLQPQQGEPGPIR